MSKSKSKLTLRDRMEASRSPLDKVWRVWFKHPGLNRWVIGGTGKKLADAHKVAREARDKVRKQQQKQAEAA